ncbi:MAG: hypothetical protein RIT22_1522 [Bacteroidota bacterium]
MSRDVQLKERWEQLVVILSDRFSQGEDLNSRRMKNSI